MTIEERIERLEEGFKILSELLDANTLANQAMLAHLMDLK